MVRRLNNAMLRHDEILVAEGEGTDPNRIRERDMTAFVDLQQAESASEEHGYTATRHQREVGAGYFDQIALAVDPQSSTGAMEGSTESSQFA